MSLLVDGGDFKLVEMAWFQALGSGTATARLKVDTHFAKLTQVLRVLSGIAGIV